MTHNNNININKDDRNHTKLDNQGQSSETQLTASLITLFLRLALLKLSAFPSRGPETVNPAAAAYEASSPLIVMVGEIRRFIG